ncbi:MAG TPA: EpsI family protein [Terriglobia bacterium]|nr:EpsI family protein [Terriglobia bacterium]
MARFQIRIAVLLGLMLGTLVAVESAVQAKAQRVREVSWDRVPYQLGAWKGKDTEFNPVYGFDPADSSLLRIYRRDSADPVIVYVGFHRELLTGLDMHSPDLCYPAQGWALISQKTSELGRFRSTALRVNEIVVSKNGEFRLVAWWYQSGSRDFQGRIRQVYGMMFLAMFNGRTDGDIVRLEVPFRNRDEEQKAHERLLRFTALLFPALDRALPM